MWIEFRNGALDVCEIRIVDNLNNQGKAIILNSSARNYSISCAVYNNVDYFYKQIVDAIHKGDHYLQLPVDCNWT